jgi:hypothetical protein
MVHGSDFIPVDGLGIETRTQGYDIDGEPLFSQIGQPMNQDTLVLDGGNGKGFKEGEAETWAEDTGDRKKKGTSQRTIDYINKEGLVLCHSWLSIIQDPICGAEQKGHAYWKKVTQELYEHR